MGLLKVSNPSQTFQRSLFLSNVSHPINNNDDNSGKIGKATTETDLYDKAVERQQEQRGRQQNSRHKRMGGADRAAKTEDLKRTGAADKAKMVAAELALCQVECTMNVVRC